MKSISSNQSADKERTVGDKERTVRDEERTVGDKERTPEQTYRRTDVQTLRRTDAWTDEKTKNGPVRYKEGPVRDKEPMINYLFCIDSRIFTPDDSASGGGGGAACMRPMPVAASVRVMASEKSPENIECA